MHGGGERGDRQRVAAGVRDVRAGGAQRVVDAEEVDRDGALEDRRVAADERQLRGDPGVGHHDVEPAELADGRLDRAVDLLAVARRRIRARARRRSRPPRARARSGSSPSSATRAPRSCSRRAVPAPMPRAAPVIRTRLPGEAHARSFAFIRSNSSSEIVPFAFRSASFAQLVGRRGPGRVADVGVHLLFRLALGGQGALAHPTAAHDQVDQRGQERDEDEEEHPDRLGRPRRPRGRGTGR